MAERETKPLLDYKSDGDNNIGFSFRRLMIIPVIFGYFFPIGMVMYITTEYVHEKTNNEYSGANEDGLIETNSTYNPCKGNDSGPVYDRYKYVQQETAKWQNYFSLVRTIPAILANLIWASYSDVIGRKALLILCTAGYCVKTLIVTIVIHFNSHIAFILIGEFVDGFVGTYTTFLAVLFAFVADITAPGRKRTVAIVLCDLILGLIFSASSVATGYFIQYHGYFYPSVTAFVIAFVAVCIATIFVPETITVKKTGGCKRLISSVSTAFKLYFKPESKRKQLKYFLLMAAFIFYNIQLLNRSSLETLYQLGKPFCWSSTKVGWFGAARKACVSLFGIAGMFVMKRFLADDTIAVIGSGLTAGSYVVEGLAKTEAELYTVPVLNAMAVLPVPMIRSLMSQLTPAEKQGALFATIGAFETLCSLIGAVTGNLVYSATLSIMNGFVFLMFAAITAIGGLILVIFMCVHRNNIDDPDSKLTKECQIN